MIMEAWVQWAHGLQVSFAIANLRHLVDHLLATLSCSELWSFRVSFICELRIYIRTQINRRRQNHAESNSIKQDSTDHQSDKHSKRPDVVK